MHVKNMKISASVRSQVDLENGEIFMRFRPIILSIF